MDNLKAKAALERVGTIQTIKARHMCCPRCGENKMYERIHTNALSRHAACYICPDCGTDEAMRDFIGNPLPLSKWDIIVNVLDVLNGEDQAQEADE